MRIVLMAIGVLVILFGLADLIGNLAGKFDLWKVLGVTLPAIIWKYSAYIAMVVGYGIFALGKSMGVSEEASA